MFLEPSSRRLNIIPDCSYSDDTGQYKGIKSSVEVRFNLIMLEHAILVLLCLTHLFI
jgi:hypothetical protein